MDKFSIDWSDVEKAIFKDTNKIFVKGNEHKLVKVAFDLFKFKNDPKEELWKVQADDDGNEFLVRIYSLPEENIKESNWSIKEDAKMANLTVCYNNVPIHRIAASQIETSQDLVIFKNMIIEKLSSDDSFTLKFLKTLPKFKLELVKNAGLASEISACAGGEREGIREFLGLKEKKEYKISEDMMKKLHKLANKYKVILLEIYNDRTKINQFHVMIPEDKIEKYLEVIPRAIKQSTRKINLNVNYMILDEKDDLKDQFGEPIKMNNVKDVADYIKQLGRIDFEHDFALPNTTNKKTTEVEIPPYAEDIDIDLSELD